MSFTPILSNQSISYAENRYQYRNAPRENAWGSPVFACGPNTSINDYISYPGPKYQYGYNYYNSPATNKGNCTWWCWGRCLEANGTELSLHLGDAKNWYDNYSGSKSRNADNIQPGDIIVFTDSDAGHVQFVEQVSGNTVYISQSAYSTRSVWNGMSCLVTSYSKNEIYQGNSLDMYKNLGSAYYETVVGVLHTGEAPTPEPETPRGSFSPSSASSSIDENSDSVTRSFDITILGMPVSAYCTGSFSLDGCTMVSQTGWNYSFYTGQDGNTYGKAEKTITVRYNRESNDAYSTTKTIRYTDTFTTGSVNIPATWSISVAKKKSGAVLFLQWDGGYAQIL